MYLDQLHLIIILSSFLISFILTPIAIKLSFKFGILNNPAEKRISDSSIPLLGSLPVGISFFLISLYFSEIKLEIIMILIFAFVNLAIGIVDDKLHLRSRTKFIFPLLATLCLVLFGISIKFLPYYILNILITIIFIYGIINAYNFIDNMDGISTGVTLISSFAFGLFSLKTDQSEIAILSFSLTGSALGFLIFNFPSAKIYLGDGGSLFFGSIISAIAVYGTWGNVESNYLEDFSFILVPLLLVGYPIYDVSYVFFNRCYHNVPPWKGDTNHTTHKLKKMGFSDSEVAVVIYVLTASLSFLAFAVYDSSLIDSIIIFLSCTSFFLVLTLILNKVGFESK